MWGAAVVAVALLARLWRLIELRGEVFWDHLLGDARIHQLLGMEIATKDFWGHEAFYRAPLYPYFLGIVFKLFGPGLLGPRAIQILLGTASCLLVFLITRRIFGRGIALAAGLICALNAVLIQYDMELEIPCLIVFLNLLGIWLLVRREVISTWGALGAGFAFGASAIVRPDLLLFVGVAAIWVFLSMGRSQRARRLGSVVLLGTLLPVVVVTVRNVAVGGGFVIVASQGGVNFYIGNNPLADGRTWSAPIVLARDEYNRYEEQAKGSVWAKDNIWLVSKAGAERALGRSLSPRQVSSYWLGQGLRFAAGSPAAFVRLLIRKAYYLANRAEIHSGLDIDALSDRSALLRALLWLGWGILLPFGLAGLLIVWKRSGPLPLMAGYLAAYATVIVLFFVNARFRVPMIPALALLACGGVAGAGRSIRKREWRHLASYGAILLVVALISNSSWAGVRNMRVTIPIHNQWGDIHRDAGRVDLAIAQYLTSLRYGPDYAETHQSLGAAYILSGQLDLAERSLTRAIELDPKYALAMANLGWLREKQGRDREAVELYRQSIATDPSLRLARTRLAAALAKQGDPAGAIEQYERLLQESPGDPGVLSELARLDLVRGDYPRARRHLEDALRVDPGNARLHHNLGIVLGHLGDQEQAIAEFHRAIDLDPTEVPPRLRLARVYEDSGRDSLALRHYDEIIDRVPTATDAHLGRARIHLRGGRNDLARRELDWILERWPENEAARKMRSSMSSRGSSEP